MRIEVTEKEAHYVYSQRYLDKHGGNKFIIFKMLPILAVASIASLLIMIYINDWLGLVALIFIASPTVYLALRLLRNSCKYANKQIGEQG